MLGVICNIGNTDLLQTTTNHNWPVAHITQCTSPVSHNAPFCNRNVHMGAPFCYKMVHCGTFVQCIVGFLRWVNCWLQHNSWELLNLSTPRRWGGDFKRVISKRALISWAQNTLRWMPQNIFDEVNIGSGGAHRHQPIIPKPMLTKTCVTTWLH